MEELKPNYQLLGPPICDATGVITYSLTCEYQKAATTVRVLLPDRDVSVRHHLYVLPVQPELGKKYGDGLEEIQKEALHDRYGMIIIAPSFSDYPWYVDHPTDPHLQQESYVTNVVLPLVDEYYPLHNGKRLLMGFSKSGYGALNLLLRHPDLFYGASIWDASMLRDRPLPEGLLYAVGTLTNYEQYRIKNTLMNSSKLFSDQKRIGLLGFGILRQDTQEAHQLMATLGIQHEYIDGPEREHTWTSGWVGPAVEILAQMVT